MINEPLIVLTIGSTGSSVLMKMLAKCGLWVGHTYAEKSKDFYENKWFKNYNQLVLGDNEYKSLDAHALDNIVTDESLYEIRQNAIDALVDQGYSGVSWGFKDPRTLATFPIWHKVFPYARWLCLTRASGEIEQGNQKLSKSFIAMRQVLMNRAVRAIESSRGRLMQIDYQDMPRLFPVVCSYAGLDVANWVMDAAQQLWRPKRYEAP